MRDTTRIVPFAFSTSALERIAAPAGSPLPFPRLLLVLAHPDDEVLAMGGRLECLVTSRILTVTDGTPRDGVDAQHHGFPTLEAYRAARREELACALRHAGLPEAVTAPLKADSSLPFPDQTAALHLPALIDAIQAAIAAFVPEAVLTHPYEGGHPDHDACAFAVHTAVRRLQAVQMFPGNHSEPPIVLEAPFYHAGADGSIETGCFLNQETSTNIRICELSPEEQAKKQARLACFASQAETLSQFSTTRELFRVAPPYDFMQSPHPGRLFYEQFPWGMAGDRFRALAAEALEQLDMTAASPSTPRGASQS